MRIYVQTIAFWAVAATALVIVPHSADGHPGHASNGSMSLYASRNLLPVGENYEMEVIVVGDSATGGLNASVTPSPPTNNSSASIVGGLNKPESVSENTATYRVTIATRGLSDQAFDLSVKSKTDHHLAITSKFATYTPDTPRTPYSLVFLAHKRTLPHALEIAQLTTASFSLAISEDALAGLRNDSDLTQQLVDAMGGRPVFPTISHPFDLDLPASTVKTGFINPLKTYQRELAAAGFNVSTGWTVVNSTPSEDSDRLLSDAGFTTAIIRSGDLPVAAGRSETGVAYFNPSPGSIDMPEAQLSGAQLSADVATRNSLIVYSEAPEIDTTSVPPLLETFPPAEGEPPFDSESPLKLPDRSRTVSKALSQAEHLVAAYQSMHASDNTELAVAQAFGKLLTLENPTPEDTKAIEDKLTDQFQQIKIVGGQSLNLASRSGAIPITLTNSSEGIRRVRLTLTSDKIDVEIPSQLVVLNPGINVISSNIDLRSLGVSLLDVEIRTPDNGVSIHSKRLRVRSSTVPKLGLVLTGLALVGLLVWWRRSIKSRRSAAE